MPVLVARGARMLTTHRSHRSFFFAFFPSDFRAKERLLAVFTYIYVNPTKLYRISVKISQLSLGLRGCEMNSRQEPIM